MSNKYLCLVCTFLFSSFFFLPKSNLFAGEEKISLEAIKIDEGKIIGTRLVNMEKIILELPGYFPVDSIRKWQTKNKIPRKLPYSWWIFKNRTSQVYKWIVFFHGLKREEKKLVESPAYNYFKIEFKFRHNTGQFVCTEIFNGGLFPETDSIQVKSLVNLHRTRFTKINRYIFQKKLNLLQTINKALFLYEVGHKQRAIKTLENLIKSPARNYFLAILLVKEKQFSEAKKLLVPLLEDENNKYAIHAKSLLMANKK
ncbi:tetratricopeptide repeat protein [Candidatus Riflebacteria bacterium]